MSFMEPETTYGNAYMLETPCGTELVPCEVCGVCDFSDDQWWHEDGQREWSPRAGRTADIPSDLADYCESDRAESIQLVTGWFARLSAPGYLDCTEWSGPYATEAEALAELASMYGSDDDDCE